MKKIFAVMATLVLVTAIVFGAVLATASADTPEPCVPSEAWTEIVEHPAVTHDEVIVVVDEPGYSETVTLPGIWWNFSPNNNHEPFDGPPTWPTDERGTWHDHGQLPPGQAGPDGVYQQGQGNGSWFYRAQGKSYIIDYPPVTHEETITVVDEEAWTETIEHEAVECDDLTDSIGPTDPSDPTDPVDPVDPTDPVVPNNPPTPERDCLGEAWVVKKFDAEGNQVYSSTVNGDPRCAPGTRRGPDDYIVETG
jgi:hypothetical protein